MKRKFLALLLVAILVTMMFPFSSLVTMADNDYYVIVHFYNGENQYSYSDWGGQSDVRWGAYYWIDSGKVVESGTKDNQEIDEDFYKDDNHGRIFRIKLNALETSAVKAGKKLGLIMVKSYMDNLGYLTPHWNGTQDGDTAKDFNADRLVTCTFDSNNEYHVWIIAGDKNNYQSLDSAKSAFERVQSAKFDDFNNLIIQTTKPITKQTNIQLYKVDDLASDEEGVLYKDNLHVSLFADSSRMSGTITGLNMEKDFDWNADYQVYIEDVSVFRTSCIKSRLYLSDKFQNECVPASNTELGAIYTPSKTTFKVWAPVSTNVFVNFYKSGNELDTTLYSSAVAMTLDDKGVWTAEVAGDLNGVYYTYTNYVEGSANEVCDIYATAVGVNGNRAMVCDMNATNPDGWEQDLKNAEEIRKNNSDTAVIWEIHVRDFSISADNGITYKGKYLAFTENNTTIKGETIKTGVNYLKDLGINYVHLNPVYDFATVDEEYNNNTDYKSKQNWGYDPKNYNVPEGSYATNAEDGEVRINEFKQMVQALHNEGIGVIMDVVYNHTYTSDSWFDQTVPGYYYRQALAGSAGTFGHKAWATNALGIYNLSDGTGCSNETASERAMFRKYMIDSLVYWASEYHIDGFRFDLMGCHDVETMNMIRQELNKLPAGEKILMYGEPWHAFTDIALEAVDGQPAVADNLNLLDTGIKAFNDRIREGIKGGNGWGGSGPTSGYVQGNASEENINRVSAGINGLFLKYDQNGVISDDWHHTITYTTSHDNYTLWDQLLYTTVGMKSPTAYSEYNSVVEKKNMMAATLVLTSKGTSFILAGEEIARTKYGNHNSYNAQDKINAIDYYRQEEFSTLYNWYKGLIELRTTRFKTIATGNNSAVVSNVDGKINYTFTSERSDDQYKKVQVWLNPFETAQTVTLTGTWTIIADGKTFNFDSTKTATGKITLPAYSSVILVQK